ncbi:glycosyltransferase [Nocardia takedensis]|uniref:glycosyltransferase n=1 Tax=Nocardia takedensis TaxID=259390 RepID=UPI000592EAC6|nr:glycosyltransferase [Nocardia takedensis]
MIRVASVPGSHVYVRHLSAPDRGDRVIRLPDPVPADGRTVPGGWWPPLMLDPAWIRAHHARFDVFHIHFGFDALDARTLTEVVDTLRAHGKPLVYTVHDLRNPHQPDPREHREHLDVLVPAADALITLTDGAAEEIHRRWGRSAEVLPHPHVVGPALLCSPRRARTGFVVGVHVKSLRANMDPLPVLDTLADAVRSLPDTVLRVDVHDELFDPRNHWYNPEVGERLLAYGHRPQVDVRVHPYFSDAELWRYLSELSVSVLPYRFGTHSGWLEACHDLGTAVIAPDCGYYHDQRPCHTYGHDEERFDPDSLVRALRAARTAAVRRPGWPERRAERAELARAHRRIYERVCR